MSKRGCKKVDKPKEKQKNKKLDMSSRIPRDYIWKVLTKTKQDLLMNPECSSDEYFNAALQSFGNAVRHRDVKQYILGFCEGPASLSTVRDYIVRGGHDLRLPIIRALRLLTLGQKVNFEESPFDQKGSAFKAFVKYEARCRYTNRNGLFEKYLSDVDDGTLNTYESLYLVPRFRSMRAFIHRVLGDQPDLSFLENQLRHGPGATTEKRGDESILIEKFVPPIDVTRLAAPAIIDAIQANHQWMNCLRADRLSGYREYEDQQAENYFIGLLPSGIAGWIFSNIDEDPNDDPVDQWVRHGLLVISDNSRISFVDKNAKILRTIEPQPTGLILYQLGIDKLIRDNLKKIGIDLTDQSKNRTLAGRGTTDHLATLDLAGASDCNAYSSLNLFPVAWRRLIEKFRCKTGIIEGYNVVVPFEKVSAMGNGYTFSLETLIFTAAVNAVLEERGLTLRDKIADIAVYGDDIIVPENMVNDVIVTLCHMGYWVNSKKSFTFGPIRESCGFDYYLTDRIDRPTFSDTPKTIWELVRDHNLLFEWERRNGFSLTKTREFIVSLIPEKYRVYGPVVEDVIGWIHTVDVSRFPEISYEWYFQNYFFTIKKARVVHPEIRVENRKRRLEIYEPILRFMETKPAFSLTSGENRGCWTLSKFRQDFGPCSLPKPEIALQERKRDDVGDLFAGPPFFCWPETEVFPDFRCFPGSKPIVHHYDTRRDDYYYIKGVVVVRLAMTRQFIDG